MAIANITNNILTDSGVATSSLLTTSAAASTYLALAGGTLTGALSGTSATFSSSVTTGSMSINSSTIQNTGNFYIGTNNANFIQFYTSNTDRMVITSGGNLLIGTTCSSIRIYYKSRIAIYRRCSIYCCETLHPCSTINI